MQFAIFFRRFGRRDITYHPAPGDRLDRDQKLVDLSTAHEKVALGNRARCCSRSCQPTPAEAVFRNLSGRTGRVRRQSLSPRGISQAQKKSRHRVLEWPTLDQRLVWSMWGPIRPGTNMAMFDFAVLAVKVLFFVWAVQLVWIGSRILERPAKRVLRSVPKSHRSSPSIKFLRLRSRHRSELFLR
jgi:hypothetical protein